MVYVILSSFKLTTPRARNFKVNPKHITQNPKEIPRNKIIFDMDIINSQGQEPLTRVDMISNQSEGLNNKAVIRARD